MRDPNLWVQKNYVKQPNNSDSSGPGNMSSSGTSTFDNHLDHSFIVIKDVQHSSFVRRIHV